MRLGIVTFLFCLALPALFAADYDRLKWDQIYGQESFVYGTKAVPTLRAWRNLLKSHAAACTDPQALDIACGEAQNGVYLAGLGYRVDGIDISHKALTKGRRHAARFKVAERMRFIQADLDHYNLPRNSYDCIVNIRFCLRRLTRQIKRALKPGGILVYETYTVDDDFAADPGATKSHFLERNELKRMFRDFDLLYYHERQCNNRALATLIARKRGHERPFVGAVPNWPQLEESGACECHSSSVGNQNNSDGDDDSE